MDILSEALKVIDGVGQYSGGLVPFKDMAFMERIKDDETVGYYHTDWLPTNFPDEQKQIIIIQRVKKVKAKSNGEANGK